MMLGVATRKAVEDARWFCPGTGIQCLVRHWEGSAFRCGYVVVPPGFAVDPDAFAVDVTGEFRDADGRWIGFVGAPDADLAKLRSSTEAMARVVQARIDEAQAVVRAEVEARAAESKARAVAAAVAEAVAAEALKPWPRWERSPLFPEGTGWTLACRGTDFACVAGIRVVLKASPGNPRGVTWWHPPKKGSLQKVASVAEAVTALASRGIPTPNQALYQDLQ